MKLLSNIMKATTVYNGITAVFTFAVLVQLLITDILYLSDKSYLSVIILMFGTMEFLKYFIILSKFPKLMEAIKRSGPTIYSYLDHRNSSDKFKQITRGLILMIAMTILYHIAIILLGAGVFEKFEETFLFSVLLCILTFLPLCLYFGPNSALALLFNVNQTNFHSFEAILKQNVYITLFGAWVGAFVIPLDWDRPWQTWPIPCAVGALSGYGISHIIKLPSPHPTKCSV